MTKHELQGTFTVHASEGSIDLKEFQCGSKYVVAEIGANYCPNCGVDL